MSELKELNKEELFTFGFSSTQDAVDLIRNVFVQASENGVTQAALARATGKNKSHINRILRGNIDGIQIGTIEVILRAMNHRLKIEAEDLNCLEADQTNWTALSPLSEKCMPVLPSRTGFLKMPAGKQSNVEQWDAS